MSQATIPGDLEGLYVTRLAKITGLSMTATSVTNWYVNGPKTVMVVAAVLSNFSAFPDGTALPATWAFSYGSAPNGATAPTAPTNLRAALAPNPTVTPYVITQSMTTSAPYLQPWFTVYFAVSTATNGAGTFDATLYGGILSK
jgi:hypothetical protein